MSILFVCLLFFGGSIVIGQAEGELTETPWPASKARCDYMVESLNSVSKFLEFAKELDLHTEPKQDRRHRTKTINDCLHSDDGEGDVRALADIALQLPAVHSVCEPEFIDKLYELLKRIDFNGTRGILKRKPTHGLFRFASLLIGQVILTCKRNLETKLEQAEQTDEDLRHSLDVIDSDNGDIRHLIEANLPESKAELPEDLSTAMAMRLRSISDDAVYLPLFQTGKTIAEQLKNVYEACKIIDSYAQGSIYPIVRFAMDGFMAGDDDDVTDNKLKSSPRVNRWLKVVRYCQGAVQVAPVSMIGVPLESDIGTMRNRQINKLDSKTFEMADQFEDIGLDLKYSFHPQEPQAKGVRKWIKKLNQKFQNQ